TYRVEYQGLVFCLFFQGLAAFSWQRLKLWDNSYRKSIVFFNTLLLGFKNTCQCATLTSSSRFAISECPRE
uniref:Uncharacterized protein n=1 Tax=Amphimedon queenslandica TaxID=400682 RepID=A0A1X7VPA1_AMPQE